MDLQSALRATRQWVPFASRTIAYGTVSLTLGPLTRDRRASLWAMRRWCQTSAHGLDIETEASGLENVPSSGGGAGAPPRAYVYCSNHQSVLDILVLGGVLPGDFKWAAKRSLMKIPFLGWHLQLAGHVPVDRNAGTPLGGRGDRPLRGGAPEGQAAPRLPRGDAERGRRAPPVQERGLLRGGARGRAGGPRGARRHARADEEGRPRRGDGRMRNVRVRIGAPIEPKREGREAARVQDIRDRTHQRDRGDAPRARRAGAGAGGRGASPSTRTSPRATGPRRKARRVRLR